VQLLWELRAHEGHARGNGPRRVRRVGFEPGTDGVPGRVAAESVSSCISCAGVWFRSL